MKSKLMMLLLLCLLLPWSIAAGESIVDAAPTCRVWLNGQKVTNVYETAVCHQRYWTAEPTLSTTPVAIASCSFPCEVEIELLNAQLESAVVRPLALGIEPDLRNGRVCFSLNEPANLTVEYNGQVQGALHLFVDAPDADKPNENTPKVRYFGPGVYRDVIITPRSNETIYLDEGCVIYGQIFCGMGHDFTIAGHGVLCGSIYDRYEDTIVPISLTNCSDFTIRDITILDPSAWTVNLLKCTNVAIDHVKIVSARSNSDGFTLQNCHNVTVSDCFVRSWDDSLVVKGYNGDVSNITFERCVLWTDLAQSCEIGYETRAKSIENITFRDITVLHNFHKPVLSIHNSDQAAVRSVLYEDIVVEDAQMGEGDGTPYLIDLTTTESQWSASALRGTIDQVTIRNVQVLSGKKPSIRIYANDESSWIDHVSISNLVVLGEQIRDFDQLPYESSPYNGENIGFAENEGKQP